MLHGLPELWYNLYDGARLVLRCLTQSMLLTRGVRFVARLPHDPHLVGVTWNGF